MIKIVKEDTEVGILNLEQECELRFQINGDGEDLHINNFQFRNKNCSWTDISFGIKNLISEKEILMLLKELVRLKKK